MSSTVSCWNLPGITKEMLSTDENPKHRAALRLPEVTGAGVLQTGTRAALHTGASSDDQGNLSKQRVHFEILKTHGNVSITEGIPARQA